MKPADLSRALKKIAGSESGEKFMGDPARWYDEGPRCLACRGDLWLSFPEDEDGPLTHSALT